MSRRPLLSALRRPLSVLAVTAVGITPLAGAVAPAEAAVDADQVVISEVYGGGNSGTSAWNRDYVELYNPTDQAISLAGTSVQYRSSGGTANPTGVTPLSGSIPAKGYFLVGQQSGSVGSPVPTPDVSGSIPMSGTAGTVFLASQATALSAPPTGSITGHPAIIDLVGYGSTNTFEKAPTAPTSTSTSAARTATGLDTDDNSADLVVGAGTPGAAPAGGGTPPPPPPPVSRTIAEIQGTGSTSPLVGQAVTTTGVVTAAYPSGGINGFYLQTAGTGGDVDPAGQQASHGIFVYGAAVAGAVEVGEHVEVTGAVSEYQGLTQITPGGTADVKVLTAPAVVQPATVVLPRSEDSRESFEGMLLAPQGPYTVSDNYSLNRYAEIGLAAGTTPLFAPTEVADPRDTAAINGVKDENAARAVTLDDGATTNFLTAAGDDIALPYLTQERQIRVGAPVTFSRPVVLDWRFGQWRFQPTAQVTAADPLPVAFGPTRAAAPAAVGGNVQIASMNVLNYFTTTGEEFTASGGSCTWYTDRAGNRVTVNSCTGPGGTSGPRGAAEADDLARQQAKIVSAINGLDADVVSLEEIENSAKFGKDRDAAVSTLVDALNDDAGAGTWQFVPSPAGAGDQADEDVIRTAFIYRTTAVRPVGESLIHDVAVYDIARDPLAQAFEAVGGGSYSRFVVIVNHFKSKGSGPDDGTGQGNSNPQRVAQAEELVRFADQMKTRLGTGKVFLSGDFNSYTREDPMRTLSGAGYTNIGATQSPEEFTYLFGGRVGSLDHVLGSEAAMQTVTGAHVWNINAVEPVALEYSRHNNNATDFYEAGPFRASDHDPLVVGLDLPLGAVPTTTSATSVPDPVEFRGDPATLRVEVGSAYGVVDAGVVRVSDDKGVVGESDVENGVATILLPAKLKKGGNVFEVDYLGTADAAASHASVTVEVVKTKRS